MKELLRNMDTSNKLFPVADVTKLWFDDTLIKPSIAASFNRRLHA